MGRLIDADALNNSIEEEFDGVCTYDVSPSTAVSDFQAIVYAQPTIEAAPVVHGKWIEVGKICGVQIMKCSACGKEQPTLTKPYCCYCGAKMDGGADQ